VWLELVISSQTRPHAAAPKAAGRRLAETSTHPTSSCFHAAAKTTTTCAHPTEAPCGVRLLLRLSEPSCLWLSKASSCTLVRLAKAPSSRRAEAPSSTLLLRLTKATRRCGLSEAAAAHGWLRLSEASHSGLRLTEPTCSGLLLAQRGLRLTETTRRGLTKAAAASHPTQVVTRHAATSSSPERRSAETGSSKRTHLLGLLYTPATKVDSKQRRVRSCGLFFRKQGNTLSFRQPPF